MALKHIQKPSRFLEKENATMPPRELSKQVLRPGAIEERLPFPKKNLDYLPFEHGSDEVQIVVRQLGNEWRAWTLCCSKRTGRYAKPVITRATWRLVVHDNGLQVGDRLKFYIDNEGDGHPPRFWVTVERRGIWLLGTPVHHPAASWKRIV